MAKYLGVFGGASDYDDGSNEDDWGQSDPFFVAARSAHHLTGSIVNSLVHFSVNEKLFDNRPAVYAMRAGRQAVVEIFEGILIEGIEKGAPATLRPTGVTLDLGLSMIAGLHGRAFATTTLPALVDVAHNVVEQAAELGLE